MKLSGHSYNNDVFSSLLNNICKDVAYTKKASKPQVEADASSMFSSTTEEDLHRIQEDELRTIASELEFAADKVNVKLSRDQLAVFAKEAISQKLRGKRLERAAQKFCGKLYTEDAPPRSDSRNIHSADLLDNANNSAVIPAGYNPEFGQSDTKTGGYMGQSMNPNSIWDADALQRLANIPTGDEQIRASKEAREQSTQDQKQQHWDDLQKQLSDKHIIQEKSASVANTSTTESAGDQKLPANSMSIFSDDRDFNNIPEKTAGETLKESAETRAEKKAEAKSEWNKSEPCKRASIDSMFEGLLGDEN